MISYIKGILQEILLDHVIVEAGNSGVGYKIFIPASLIDRLPQKQSEIKLHTYFQVREDGMSLYGFLNIQDREMFRQLISVNGIGPKAALALLSVLSPDELRMAIISGDAKAISKAPGVGAKTAQRVIIDLKDKISLEEILPSHDNEVSVNNNTEAAENVKEVAAALVSLGYSQAEALKAVRRVELTDDMNVETILKMAFKFLV